MTASIHETARVCVERVRSCPAVESENTESHDGGASPRRGPVRSTGRFRTATTTNYTLRLVCSSSRRETNFKISYLRGVST